MTKLPEFLICSNRDELPGPVIISSRAPYIVGKIWRFKDDLEWINFINNPARRGLGSFMATVTGYRIAICFDGSFTGPKITVQPGFENVIMHNLKGMAAFYMKEMVERKEGFYKKFKL